MINLVKNLNPSPLVGVGDKFIVDVLQCSSGILDNNFPLYSPKYCHTVVNNNILETVTIVKG